jgi:hypothetical protein
VCGVLDGRTADAAVFLQQQLSDRADEDAGLVHVEMIHDARIIHMDGRPDLSPTIRRWMGDSIGHWVGNTPVVDTTNFNDSGGFYGVNTLLYQFEIDDPTAFTQPWNGELTMERSPGPLYEYACHEAKYSLVNILRGYRAAERQPGGAPQR